MKGGKSKQGRQRSQRRTTRFSRVRARRRTISVSVVFELKPGVMRRRRILFHFPKDIPRDSQRGSQEQPGYPISRGPIDVTCYQIYPVIPPCLIAHPQLPVVDADRVDKDGLNILLRQWHIPNVIYPGSPKFFTGRQFDGFNKTHVSGSIFDTIMNYRAHSLRGGPLRPHRHRAQAHREQKGNQDDEICWPRHLNV